MNSHVLPSGSSNYNPGGTKGGSFVAIGLYHIMGVAFVFLYNISLHDIEKAILFNATDFQRKNSYGA